MKPLISLERITNMINEHDIEDMCVPLYTLNKGTKFKLSDEEVYSQPSCGTCE
jgi:hypothetical protein